MNRKVICIVAISLGLLFLSAALVLATGGSVKLVINGKEVVCDTPAQIVNNRTLVPLRVVAENLGAEVKWSETDRTVIITTKTQETPFQLLKLNGEQTTWPYWYEDGQLYMEYRNVVELVREARPGLHSISFFPQSNTLSLDNRKLQMQVIEKGQFKVVAVDYLRYLDYLDYEFFPEEGNIIVLK